MSKIDIVNRLKNSLVWLKRDGFLTSAKNALDAVSEINELRAENARLAAEVERLTKERDDDRRREYGYSQQTVDALQSTIATLQARIDELEAERAARKTAQESLEQYKGECTRLQHEVDRLNGEGAQQAEDIEQLKNAISLSEDSRLMDEHMKLERDHERQAKRIKALERAVKFNDETAQHYLTQRTEAYRHLAQQASALDLARARVVAAKNVIGWDEVPYKLHVALDALFDALDALPAAGQAGKGGAE